jgi:ubiquinone biosynthesis monooxygenase Coq7
MKTAKKKRSLPGDLSTEQNIEQMVRVNHAGEYGAQQIYKGQIAILGNTDVGPVLKHMAEQEDVHLKHFENELTTRRIRPTLLQPVWKIAGFALGAGTALLGREAAMACTEAVEEIIVEHYNEQLNELDGNTEEKPLRKAIEKFRDEEDEHRQIGVDHDAHQSPAYTLLSEAIKAGSKTAIWLSKRI